MATLNNFNISSAQNQDILIYSNGSWINSNISAFYGALDGRYATNTHNHNSQYMAIGDAYTKSETYPAASLYTRAEINSMFAGYTPGDGGGTGGGLVDGATNIGTGSSVFSSNVNGILQFRKLFSSDIDLLSISVSGSTIQFTPSTPTWSRLITDNGKLDWSDLKNVPDSATGTVAWSGITGKPATATRWPTLTEIGIGNVRDVALNWSWGTGTITHIWGSQGSSTQSYVYRPNDLRDAMDLSGYMRKNTEESTTGNLTISNAQPTLTLDDTTGTRIVLRNQSGVMYFDVAGSAKKIYHEGNKPTASEVGAIPSNSDITVTKNKPWIILDSSSSGSNYNEQAAGISIGESGTGSAALHLTYTGDGKAWVGMGSVTSESKPTYVGFHMQYQSSVVNFTTTPKVNGSLLYHEGHKPTWGEVEGRPSTFTPSAHNHTWSQITDKPDTATRWPTANEVGALPLAGKAADSDKLDGYQSSQGVDVSTVAVRNGSGDLYARLFRSTYGTQTSMSATADLCFRNNESSDNYMRFVTRTGLANWLEGENKFALNSHNHSAANITSGTLSDARLPLTLSRKKIDKAAHTSGSGDSHFELYAPQGSTSGEVSMMFHQGSRFYYQLRARADGMHVTGGANNTLAKLHADFVGSLTGNATSATNADTVDNLHASAFARREARTDGYVWIRRNSASSALYVTNQTTGRIVDLRKGSGDGATVASVENSGEIISRTSNGFRIVSGTRGVMFRNDGSSFYILKTAANDQYGGWDGARPLTINLSTGIADINGNAATVTNGVYTNTTQTITGSKTFSGSTVTNGSLTANGASYLNNAKVITFNDDNSGGSVNLSKHTDDYIRWRFSGTPDLKGVSISNYDTVGIYLNRAGWASFSSFVSAGRLESVSASSEAQVDLKSGTNIARIFWRDSDDNFGFYINSATRLRWTGNDDTWTATGTFAASRFAAGYDANQNNSMSCSNWFRSSGGTGWLSATYGGGIHMSDLDWVRIWGGKKFYVSSTSSDSIKTAGGILASGIVKGADATATSDRRLKSDFEPIVNALGKIDTLSGQTYTHKLMEGRKAGLVAQDVEQVLPEAVMEDEDGIKQVSPWGVIALLTNAIKELKAEVQELKRGY